MRTFLLLLPKKAGFFGDPAPSGLCSRRCSDFFFEKISRLFRPLPNSVFAVRRNFGLAFGQKELGEKPLLCGRFASFSPKMLEILGVVFLEHKNGLTPFKKFGFWQCAAFCMKLNNIFALLFPASTLFSPLFFKLIFLRFFLFLWSRKENCVTINPKRKGGNSNG